MYTGKLKALIAAYAVVIGTAIMLSPFAYAQGTAGGTNAQNINSGNPAQMNTIPSPTETTARTRGQILTDEVSGNEKQLSSSPSVGIKSNSMDVPGKRTNAEGILHNGAPPLRVTGDPGMPNQKQINEYKALPDEGIGMYPSDFPIQTLYSGPEYVLDPAEKVAVFLWMTALIVLSLVWFFYSWFWADAHAPQYLHN
jgi:hypothetical protein